MLTADSQVVKMARLTERNESGYRLALDARIRRFESCRSDHTCPRPRTKGITTDATAGREWGEYNGLGDPSRLYALAFNGGVTIPNDTRLAIRGSCHKGFKSGVRMVTGEIWHFLHISKGEDYES